MDLKSQFLFSSVRPGGADVANSSLLQQQDRRVRAALKLHAGPLPPVGRPWLRKYFEHLSARLQFPFRARYAGDLHPQGRLLARITIVSLVEPEQTANAEAIGLTCRALHGEQELVLPLVDMEVEEDSPNYQCIEDYWYWFWNWRFDPRI